jgi:hypothetical protein
MSIYKGLNLAELHIAFDAATARLSAVHAQLNHPRVGFAPKCVNVECARLSAMIDAEAGRRMPMDESEAETQAAICLGRALAFPEYQGEWRDGLQSCRRRRSLKPPSPSSTL